MMRKLVWLMAIALLCGWGAPAHAIGGIYPAADDDRFYLTSLEITYALDSTTNTVTAVYEVAYRDIPEFLWLIPIESANPEIEFIPQTEYSPTPVFQLPRITPPVLFKVSPNYCANLYNYDGEGSGGDGGYPFNKPEPTQTHILNPTEILPWLERSHYPISGVDIALIQDYAAQGMHFVALEITDPTIEIRYEHIASLQVKLTYQADTEKLVLPLQLIMSGQQPFNLQINILGDTQYIPENYERTSINLNNVLIHHAIDLEGWNTFHVGTTVDTFSATNYHSLRLNALKAARGQGFITELAIPIEKLLKGQNEGIHVSFSSPSLDEVRQSIGGYPYLTQMYGYIEPDLNTKLPDPVFVTAPIAPDISSIIDATHIDPLGIWGCSTRTIENSGYEEIQAALPTGRTSFYAHPQEWLASEFWYENIKFLAVAPEPIDQTTIQQYLDGESTPPMLLVHRSPALGWDFVRDDAHRQSYLRDTFELSPVYAPREPIYIEILTTKRDFAENEAMYKAMVDFPFTYQYRLHPDLRHSLYLNANGDWKTPPDVFTANIMPLMIGYPEGWIERMLIPQHVFIVPEEFDTLENFENPSEIPYVWVRPTSDITEAILAASWDERREIVAEWIVEQFGVNKTGFLTNYPNWCDIPQPFMPFEHHGRRGFFAFSLQSIPSVIEISAPTENYEQYQQTLETILESAKPIYMCG